METVFCQKRLFARALFQRNIRDIWAFLSFLSARWTHFSRSNFRLRRVCCITYPPPVPFDLYFSPPEKVEGNSRGKLSRNERSSVMENLLLRAKGPSAPYARHSICLLRLSLRRAFLGNRGASRLDNFKLLRFRDAVFTLSNDCQGGIAICF